MMEQLSAAEQELRRKKEEADDDMMMAAMVRGCPYVSEETSVSEGLSLSLKGRLCL